MASSATSTWAPLRIGVFRAMWLGVLVSNIGTWMQTVGAQWLRGRPGVDQHQPGAVLGPAIAGILIALVGVDAWD